MEEDPYRKAGLFGTVSIYRYPYNMGGEFNWHLSTFPYVALCMDKKGRGKGKLREDKRDEHHKYYEKTRYNEYEAPYMRACGGVAWVVEMRDRMRVDGGGAVEWRALLTRGGRTPGGHNNSGLEKCSNSKFMRYLNMYVCLLCGCGLAKGS